MAKPAITKRGTKAAALTYAELDTNFQNLADATVSLTAGTGGTQVTADLNGNITLVAGTGITLSGDNTGKTLTINASSAQNTFSTIAVSGQSNVVADSTSDTLTLVAGSNISLTTNATDDSVTINASVPTLPNTFSTIAVSGQSNVVADSTSDTLTLIAGSNISLTTNATNDSVTITNTAASANTVNPVFSQSVTTPLITSSTGNLILFDLNLAKIRDEAVTDNSGTLTLGGITIECEYDKGLSLRSGGVGSDSTNLRSLIYLEKSGKIYFNCRDYVQFNAPPVLRTYTTAQRDAISNAVNGMLIYNSTTGTFQGRANGTWVDLH